FLALLITAVCTDPAAICSTLRIACLLDFSRYSFNNTDDDPHDLHSFPTRRSSDLKNNTISQAHVELTFFLSKKMIVNAKAIFANNKNHNKNAANCIDILPFEKH